MTETNTHLAFLGWPEIVALLVMLLIIAGAAAVVIVLVTRLTAKPKGGQQVAAESPVLTAQSPGRLTATDLENR
jgi:hypothetical protein